MEITATQIKKVEQVIRTEERRYTSFRNAGYDRDADTVRNRLWGMVEILNVFGHDIVHDEDLLAHVVRMPE